MMESSPTCFHVLAKRSRCWSKYDVVGGHGHLLWIDVVIIHIARVWWWNGGPLLLRVGAMYTTKPCNYTNFSLKKINIISILPRLCVQKNMLGRGGSGWDRPYVFFDFVDIVIKDFCCWLDGVCMHFPLFFTSLVSMMWSNSTRHDPIDHVSTNFLVQTKTHLHMK